MFVPGAAAFHPAATLRDPTTRPLAGEHTHKLLSRNHVLKSPRLVRTGLVSMGTTSFDRFRLACQSIQ
jgi:hypothetical protein